MSIELKKKQYGLFFGSIIGDALGAPVEFKPRDTFPEVTDMNLDNFNFDIDLKAGCWTDDTSMMLCLSQSLIDKNGQMVLKDQLTKYLEWFRNGYMSVIDHCFDIGIGTSNALRSFEDNPELLISNNTDAQEYSGNGSLMRISPIPIVYHKDLKLCLKNAETSSISTHPSPICISACKIQTCILYLILNNIKKKDLMIEMRKNISISEVSKELYDIYNGIFLQKTRKDLISDGYVKNSLEVALYSFFKFDNFKDSVLFVVNLGGDTDTNACICGQICGAYYGYFELSINWLGKLKKPEVLLKVIDNLVKF